MSDSNSSDLSLLDYQVGGNAEVLSQAATKAQNSSRVYKNALQMIWSALPEKAIDNAVKDYHKRLQACVSANGGHNVKSHITDIKGYI